MIIAGVRRQNSYSCQGLTKTDCPNLNGRLLYLLPFAPRRATSLKKEKATFDEERSPFDRSISETTLITFPKLREKYTFFQKIFLGGKNYDLG